MHLDPQEGDDRRFLDLVTRVIRTAPTDTHELIVIRVDNWFDHKWLRFSGNGRVTTDPAVQSVFPSHPGVVLKEFSQDKLTFPPFSPRRILSQTVWTRQEDEATGVPIHRRRRGHSARNLHRRVADYSESMIATWFSSRTEDNRQGCVMQYSVRAGKVDAWYASLRVHDPSWRVHLVKGIERGRVEALMDDDVPPSGKRSTG
jgi:hypothetical protein